MQLRCRRSATSLTLLLTNIQTGCGALPPMRDRSCFRESCVGKSGGFRTTCFSAWGLLPKVSKLRVTDFRTLDLRLSHALQCGMDCDACDAAARGGILRRESDSLAAVLLEIFDGPHVHENRSRSTDPIGTVCPQAKNPMALESHTRTDFVTRFRMLGKHNSCGCLPVKHFP